MLFDRFKQSLVKTAVLDGKPSTAGFLKVPASVSIDVACRHFHGSLNIPQIRRFRMNWFLDWDGTVTTKDTLSIVASIGYDKNRRSELPPWSHFSEAYNSDYEAHMAKRDAGRNGSHSLKEFLNWQESLVDVERASVERVEQAGIFANVTTADIDDAAKGATQNQNVVLRPGLDALLERLHDGGGCITIVSVNWSARFVESCLNSAPELQSRKAFSAIRVRANDIESGPSSRLSRTFEDEGRGIWTGQDKARVMQAEIQTESQPPVSIYIGDSPSDLSCLLLADVGICVRDGQLSGEQRNLQELLTRFDIPCRPIREYTRRSCRDSTSGKELWWAKDFHEICSSALLLSCNASHGATTKSLSREEIP